MFVAGLPDVSPPVYPDPYPAAGQPGVDGGAASAAQVVYVARQDFAFGQEQATLDCSSCNKNIKTTVTKKHGLGAWIAGGAICLFW
jgi:hypothetical protein